MSEHEEPTVELNTEEELEMALFNLSVSLWKHLADKTGPDAARARMVNILSRMSAAFETSEQR